MNAPDLGAPSSDLDQLAADPGVAWVAFVGPGRVLQRPEGRAEPLAQRLYPALLDMWDTYAAVNRTPTMLNLRFEGEDILILLGGAIFLVLKLKAGADLGRITRRARTALLHQKLGA
ncbi:MAG: hypothetical protein JO069_18960 [Verrucomicrobia bacterium]|nr:hypothetical protein [Verrucomicrobiota bacterium]